MARGKPSGTPWEPAGDRAGATTRLGPSHDRNGRPAGGDDAGDDDQDPSHAELEIWSPLASGPKSGFLWSFPIQKVPRWDDKFGHEHFSTKMTSIGARRVCKKGPLKGGQIQHPLNSSLVRLGTGVTPLVALW